MTGKTTKRGDGPGGGREGDALTAIIRKANAMSRVAILIKTADALPPGPRRDRLGAQVDRLMDALKRTSL